VRRVLEHFILRGFDRYWQPGAFSAVIPVPCHPTTLRRRGFDLPALLARKLSRSREIPWRPRALSKVKVTADLVGLKPSQRTAAVAGAYAAREALDGQVLLVDDVATSTATARACAKACLQAGASAVKVLVVARTPLESW
jgi:predicted amidophosphoribosyltransferase